MTNNGESLQIGLLSPRDLGTSESLRGNSRGSSSRSAGTSSDFSYHLSRSEYARQKALPQNHREQSKSVVRAEAQTANSSHKSAATGKNLPQHRIEAKSKKHAAMDSPKVNSDVSTENRTTLKACRQRQIDENKDQERSDDTVDVRAEVNQDQAAAQDRSYVGNNPQPSTGERAELDRSEFAVQIPAVQDSANLSQAQGITASGSAHTQAWAAQNQTLALSAQTANQTDTRTTISNTGSAQFQNLNVPGVAANSAELKASFLDSSTQDPQLAAAGISDATQLANNQSNKLKNAQILADVMTGRQTGQSTGLNTGDVQQSISQDSLLLKDRFFMLAQQCGVNQNGVNQSGVNQSQTISSILDNPGLQQITGVDQSGLMQAGESTFVSRLPGNPLQLFSPALQMSSAFAQHGWSQEVGQRVVWMAQKDLQQAQLQLNPKHLGPLEIKITMNTDQQINVNFLTHSQAVKDALDQAMPKLREVFDQSGLNLNDVNVQQESARHNREQQQNNTQPASATSYVADNAHDEIPAAQLIHSPIMSSNIVDFYA